MVVWTMATTTTAWPPHAGSSRMRRKKQAQAPPVEVAYSKQSGLREG